MKKKLSIRLFFIIIIYLFALGMNFLPSIKYPDSSLSIINLIISVSLLVTTIIKLKSIVVSQNNKFIQIIMLCGICSSLFVLIAYEFQHIAHKYMILDVILGIHYPLYIVFITPLFGLNYIFNVNYGMFSGIIGIFYLLGFGSMFYHSKR